MERWSSSPKKCDLCFWTTNVPTDYDSKSSAPLSKALLKAFEIPAEGVAAGREYRLHAMLRRCGKGGGGA